MQLYIPKEQAQQLLGVLESGLGSTGANGARMYVYMEHLITCALTPKPVATKPQEQGDQNDNTTAA